MARKSTVAAAVPVLMKQAASSIPVAQQRLTMKKLQEEFRGSEGVMVNQITDLGTQIQAVRTTLDSKFQNLEQEIQVLHKKGIQEADLENIRVAVGDLSSEIRSLQETRTEAEEDLAEQIRTLGAGLRDLRRRIDLLHSKVLQKEPTPSNISTEMTRAQVIGGLSTVLLYLARPGAEGAAATVSGPGLAAAFIAGAIAAEAI
jgi:chromosome segregation ATPase